MKEKAAFDDTNINIGVMEGEQVHIHWNVFTHLHVRPAFVMNFGFP